jgi:hypothetical protein
MLLKAVSGDFVLGATVRASDNNGFLFHNLLYKKIGL